MPSLLKTQVPGLSFGETKALLSSSIIKGLDEELQEELLNTGIARSLRRGECLFTANEPVQSVYCLLSGKLKEYYSDGSGVQCLRCVQIPGSYVSLHMTFEQTQRYTYCCEALVDATYFSWDAEYFLKLVKRDSSMAFHVAAELSNVFESTCRLKGICQKPRAVPRVADYLLYRRAGCPARCAKMPLDIRPVGLAANDVYLARETFSRALASLQRRNIIRATNGIIEIVDIEELRRVSETE